MVSAESFMPLFVECSSGQEAMTIDITTLLSQLQGCGLNITSEDPDDGFVQCAVSDGESVDKKGFKCLLEVLCKTSGGTTVVATAIDTPSPEPDTGYLFF